MERRKPSDIHEVFFHWPGGIPASWDNVTSPAEEKATIRGFQHQHIHVNGWSDIGYNHVMGHFGPVPNVYTARGAQYTPAAQLGHNQGTIACCILIGPDDFLRQDVINRMRSYIRWAEEYTGNRLRVRGHGEVFGTECPGPSIRKAISSGRLDIHN